MTALPPCSTIGILGGGQLGRMLALAAARLGFKCHVYSDVSGPAFDVAAAATLGAFDDEAKLAAFARAVDAVTYEFENVPIQAAGTIARFALLRPGARALAVSQDRLAEKTFVRSLGLPVAPFAEAGTRAGLDAALQAMGTPAILKTRRMGYDGKGQARLGAPDEAAKAFAEIGGAPAILEGWVDFAFEVSVLVARGLSGEVRFYDIPLNTHEDGILRTSVVPSPLSEPHAARAREIARRIACALDYAGVLAVEMFFAGEQAAEPLIVNEIAPRVHNSGHWTIEACAASQFENHIRAVAGWPLASTERHSDATMTNLIGADALRWAELAAEPGAALHLYGKRDARPGRKMGHVTRLRPLPEAPPAAGIETRAGA